MDSQGIIYKGERRRHTPVVWSREEIDYINDRPKVPTKVMAKRLGKTPEAVCQLRHTIKKNGTL